MKWKKTEKMNKRKLSCLIIEVWTGNLNIKIYPQFYHSYFFKVSNNSDRLKRYDSARVPKIRPMRTWLLR